MPDEEQWSLPRSGDPLDQADDQNRHDIDIAGGAAHSSLFILDKTAIDPLKACGDPDPSQCRAQIEKASQERISGSRCTETMDKLFSSRVIRALSGH